MPRTSQEAELCTRYAITNPPPPPPSDLTQEQQRFWRAICTDLPAGHVRSDCTPVMVELCRHLSYAVQVAEALASVRAVPLANMTKVQRAIFFQLLRQAREQSKLIADLSVKLRLVPQMTTRARDAARLRERTPIGPRPWDWEVIAGGQDDDGDDDAGPAKN
jgi:hypothetical protein